MAEFAFVSCGVALAFVPWVHTVGYLRNGAGPMNETVSQIIMDGYCKQKQKEVKTLTLVSSNAPPFGP